MIDQECPFAVHLEEREPLDPEPAAGLAEQVGDP